MANLLGADIGTNYKGILSLDSTINTPLDATLRAVTDGEGNASGLKLSTTDSSFSGKLGIGANAPSYTFDLDKGVSGNLLARLRNSDSGGFGITLIAGNALGTYSMQWSNYLGSSGGRIYPDGMFIGAQSAPTARLQIKGSGTTSATTSLLVQNSASLNSVQVRDDRVIIMAGMPTSAAGLPSGALWNNSGVINIV